MAGRRSPDGFSFCKWEGAVTRPQEKPDSLKIGFAPDFGNDDQISFARAAEMAGIDPYRIQFLKFDSADDLFQALINHEVDAATTTITEVRHDYEKRG